MSEAKAPNAASETDEDRRAGGLDGMDPIDPIVRTLVDKSKTAASQTGGKDADAAIPDIPDSSVETVAEGANSVAGEAVSGGVEVIDNILDGL